MRRWSRGQAAVNLQIGIFLASSIPNSNEIFAEMNKAAGLLASEIVTYVLIAAILVAVAFGMFVSSERDDMAELAEASIETIKQLSEAAASDGKPLVCNNSMVKADVLANDFLSLSIKPILKNEEDDSAGFSPGLHVFSSKDEDGNDVFVTAKRLYESIKEKDEDRLREFINEDDRIEYFVLISDSVSCVDHTQIASNPDSEG